MKHFDNLDLFREKQQLTEEDTTKLIKAFIKIDHNIILNEIAKSIPLNDNLLKHIQLLIMQEI